MASEMLDGDNNFILNTQGQIYSALFYDIDWQRLHN